MNKIFVLIFSVLIPALAYAQTGNADTTTVSYSKTLNEIEVVAHYLQRKHNGDLVMRIIGNPLAEGKSTLQFLNFIPGVVSKDEAVSINGMDGTEIYIGNRKSDIEELKMIGLPLIQQIEVIKTPDTSYGNVKGGIIKIILKKEQGIASGLTLKNQEDKKGYVDAGVSNFTMFQKGKNTFFNGINYYPYGQYLTKTKREDKTSDSTIETNIKLKNRDRGLHDNFGIIHNFNENSNITVYGGFVYGKSNKKNDSKSEGEKLEIKNNEKSISYNAGAVYTLNSQKGERNRTLMLKTEFSGTNIKESNLYSYSPNEEDNGKRHYYSLSFDPHFICDLSKNSTIDMGVFIDYIEDRNNRSGINTAPLNQVLMHKYIINGSDFQPWVELQGNDKTGQLFYRIGIRYVNGFLHYKDRLNASNNYKSRNRDGLFQNVLVNWAINDTQSLKFSYRHYYSYPNYGYYNPVAVYTSDNFYSIGNQHLTMEKFHRFEIEYVMNNSISFYYQLKKGYNLIQILTHKEQGNSNVYYTMPENVGRNAHHQFSVYANSDIAKVWHTNNALYFFCIP